MPAMHLHNIEGEEDMSYDSMLLLFGCEDEVGQLRPDACTCSRSHLVSWLQEASSPEGGVVVHPSDRGVGEDLAFLDCGSSSISEVRLMLLVTPVMPAAVSQAFKARAISTLQFLPCAGRGHRCGDTCIHLLAWAGPDSRVIGATAVSELRLRRDGHPAHNFRWRQRCSTPSAPVARLCSVQPVDRCVALVVRARNCCLLNRHAPSFR
jgi:hypothetical protein